MLVANCSDSGLQNVPASLPEHTNWLLLSGNNLIVLNTINSQSTELLQYLTKLDLNGSKIRNISSAFFDIFVENNTLLYLDLSKNELRSIPENVQNLSSLQTLKMSGNKFKCSCDNFWMKDWFLDETDTIYDFENVLCQMASEKWIPIVKMDKVDMGCVPSEEIFSIDLWKIAGRY